VDIVATLQIVLAASQGGRNFWNFERKTAEQLFTGLLRLAYITTIGYFFFSASHSSRHWRQSSRVGAVAENNSPSV